MLKCKGFVKVVIKKIMSFDNYGDILVNLTQTMHSIKTIISQNHEMSYEVTKSSLSCFDNKGSILEIGKTTFSCG